MKSERWLFHNEPYSALTLLLTSTANNKITFYIVLEVPQQNTHTLKLMVDTGEDVSILPESMSFIELKTLLLESPALAINDSSLLTYITIDSSNYGLEAMLTQLHTDQVERIVTFASRALSSADRMYSTTKNESLACVWVVEKWRTFMWDHRFTLGMDHQAFTTLLNTKSIMRYEDFKMVSKNYVFSIRCVVPCGKSKHYGRLLVVGATYNLCL